MRVGSQLRSVLILSILLLIGTQLGAGAQSGNTLAKMVAQDGRFAAYHELALSAELTELLETQTLTLFIPSNNVLRAASDGSPLRARQLVLTHMVFGNYSTEQLVNMQELKHGFGKVVPITSEGGLKINGHVAIVTGNIAAANGVIHIVDQLIAPVVADGGVENSAESNNSAVNQYARPEEAPAYISDPGQNPAFVGGPMISYRSGILSGVGQCKGMTWTVHEQNGGATRIGADRRTNPYRGDTPCSQSLPLACIQVTSAPPQPNRWEGWAYGNVKATLPVSGTQLHSRQHADAICSQAYGTGWRMAEFHDGNRGTAIGRVSGYDFWAYGNLPIGERFWVAIVDQAANPWNSQVGGQSPPSGAGIRTASPGDDPAYIGDRPLRMSQSFGFSRGRNGCQGMTWVVHRQVGNRVQVGADLSSNPFVGDRSCAEIHHILCIRVDGLRPPPGSNGFNYSYGWSGGIVALSPPVSGNQISTRAAANEICQQAHGPSWRMAEFHDGLLGMGNTDGWEFWAYGVLPSGRRFWVANNDQPANPWNY